MSELGIAELDAQQSELLPAREALNHGGLVVVVGSANVTKVHSNAVSIQALTFGSCNSGSSSVTVINGAINGNG